MSERLGVAIIGTGTIANAHMRSLEHHAPAHVVAVYDVLHDRAEAFAQKWNIGVVASDLDKVLSRSDIDAVIVSTPPVAHKGPTIAALEAGKHVLCEKPFAFDPAEAEAMTETAERVGKHLAVCSARQRVWAASRKAQELASTGALGDVYHVRSSAFRFRGRPGIDILRDVHWFIDYARAGGGALIDIGVYQIDALLWILGNPKVTSVLCSTKMGIGDPVAEPRVQDVEDHAVLMFTCEGGKSGILEITWSSNVANVDQFLVFGTKAGLKFNPLTMVAPGPYNPLRPVEQKVLDVSDTDTAGFGDVSQQFVDAILAGKTPHTPARHALEVTRVMDAAYRSAKTGQAVSLH